MPRRTAWVERPGTEGVVTDIPAHQLSAKALERGGDTIMPNGLLRQRRGWDYHGTTATAAANLLSVARVKFVMSAVTRSVATIGTVIYLHSLTGAGTQVGSVLSGSSYLPRAMYHDELFFCSPTDGYPCVTWSGAYLTSDGATPSGSPTFTSGQATVSTGGAWSPGTVAPGYPGLYCSAYRTTSGTHRVNVFYRSRLGSTTSQTLEDVLATSTTALASGSGQLWSLGFCFPAVSIYDAGSITVSGGTVTGYGTEWDTGASWDPSAQGVLSSFGHAVLIKPTSGLAGIGSVNSDPSSNTSLGARMADQATKSAYEITAPLPFKDVAAHKGRLWGAGTPQHRNRVYVSPVGWNPHLPPGASTPFDPITGFEAISYLDFLLDFEDVPAPNVADPIVALMSSTGPMVVVTRRNAYGIAGDTPPFDTALLPDGDGAGCIDIRSAWELSLGPVWAGPRSVHAFLGGRVVDLCKGRIQREWADLAAQFDGGTSDYCSIGEKDGVLQVHLTTAAGTIQRTWYCYPYDESGKFNPRWLDRVSNATPRFQWSSKISGEEDKLLGVQNANQGRPIDFGPAIDGTGDARDDDGTSPAMDVRFSSRLIRDAGANLDERLLELAVEANIYDTGGTSSTLGGSVVSSQALDSTSTVTTSLTSMASANADMPRPFVHDIGVKAGLHQLRLAKSATQTTEVKTEVSRIGVTTRASKRAVG